MENVECRMENGEWEMGKGEWGMGNGRRKIKKMENGNGDWRMEIEE